MGKKKQEVEKKTTTKETKKPTEEVGKKKKRVAGKKKSAYKSYTKRLCKDKKIQPINKDAQEIVDVILERFYEGVLEQARALLQNSKKKLSHKSAVLAYLGFTKSNDISNEMTKLGLERGKQALELIQKHDADLKAKKQ
jgi:hypothetical protein